MKHQPWSLVTALAALVGSLAFPGAKIIAFPSGDLTLHGVLFKPPGSGPFPAILFNHGSAPGNYSDEAINALGPLFTSRRWVFFAPYRRGQGLSQSAGPYTGDQIAAAVKKGGMAAGASTMIHLLETDHLNDQLAALAWLQAQDFVQRKRIATIGNSFGGIEAVLGAEHAPYCAAIDASGAAESWASSFELQALMKRTVRNSRAPIFFLQAENDYDLSPSRALSAEMTAAGKVSEMKIYPPYGASKKEGHSFAYMGASIWIDDALHFLDRYCRN